MRPSLAEVKQRARRANHDHNRRTMFFSSRVSIFVTYLLAGTRATANGVTVTFSAIGVAAAAAVFLPQWWGPALGLVLYRVHVVLDVVDGELARLRQTCSPLGAYLDYLTHYLVYTSVGFGFGVHVWHLTGNPLDVAAGFAVAIGLMMNLASKDCWYRANYRESPDVEGRRPLWRGSRATIVATRVVSINTAWFMIAGASAAAARSGTVSATVPEIVLFFYAVAMPCFAIARAVLTARHRCIPRRSAWY